MKTFKKLLIFVFFIVFLNIAILISFTSIIFGSTGTSGETENSLELVSTKNITYPLATFYVTADYGFYAPFGTVTAHYGIDLATTEGTKMYGMGNGIVYSKGYDSGRGNYVYMLINAEDNYYSVAYFHMTNTSKLNIGDKFDNNTIIGYLGNTGASTGPHLHLELAPIPTEQISQISEYLHKLYRVNPRNVISFPLLNSYYNNPSREVTNE